MPLFLLYPGEQDMGLREIWIQFQSSANSANYFRALTMGIPAHDNRVQVSMRVCQANVSWRKCRVFPDCLLEVRNALLNASLGVAVT